MDLTGSTAKNGTCCSEENLAVPVPKGGNLTAWKLWSTGKMIDFKVTRDPTTTSSDIVYLVTQSEQQGVNVMQLTGPQKGNYDVYHSPPNGDKLTRSCQPVFTLKGAQSGLNNLPFWALAVRPALRPDGQVAYVWTPNEFLVSMMLVGKEKGSFVVMHDSRIPTVNGMEMLDSTTLHYTTKKAVITLDLTLTIPCGNYPFLAKGILPFPLSEAERSEVYLKYQNGVRLIQSKRVWTFIGYKRVSEPRKCAGNCKTVHFVKSLVCFGPCKKSASEHGSCNAEDQFGIEKCGVYTDMVGGKPALSANL